MADGPSESLCSRRRCVGIVQAGIPEICSGRPVLHAWSTERATQWREKGIQLGVPSGNSTCRAHCAGLWGSKSLTKNALGFKPLLSIHARSLLQFVFLWW